MPAGELFATRRGRAALVASPILVGAVTLLIVLVSIFLSYNANSGLPFVPTYDLWAELPSGANLVKDNDVRAGGFRVGLVDKIVPMYDPRLKKTIARIHMKLDRSVEPLARDTTVIVRQRSALGLKYVELSPGRSAATYHAGATIPLKFAGNPVEFDDVFSTFDKPTRENSRLALKGFGDAFAARGQSLNAAIGALSPFFVHLTPVMRNLADPRTQLDEFFRQVGRAAAEAAPVARVQAELFTNMADTFAAVDHDPSALRAAIEKAPPTLDTAVASFRTQQPFLADFTDLSRRLRPVASDLPRTLPSLNTAFRYGTPVLPRTVDLNQRTGRLFNALDDLARNPNTLLALNDLTTTVAVGAPLLTFVAPYQTVCNQTTSYFTGLSGHLSEDSKGGTLERVLVRDDNTSLQPGKLGSSSNWRQADVPSNVDPKSTKMASGDYVQALHTQKYGRAIDAAGNADCETGQNGYLTGPLPASGSPGAVRYPPHSEKSFNQNDPNDPFYRDFAGGSHVVVQSDTPGLAGTTFTGVPRLRDVP